MFLVFNFHSHFRCKLGWLIVLCIPSISYMFMFWLVMQEKEKAAEDRRRNVAEYRKFLESCDFIKVFLKGHKKNIATYFYFCTLAWLFFHFQANSQWRKIQDRLEDDERCLCLEKLDRLLIFQVCSLTCNSIYCCELGADIGIGRTIFVTWRKRKRNKRRYKRYPFIYVVIFSLQLYFLTSFFYL